MDARDQSFLRAILDRPGDDAPRLIFADFLDETGRPERAEFVRLQCAAAAARHNHRPKSSGGGKCRACVLHRRVRELLLDHAVAWTPSPPFSKPFALERVGSVLVAGQDGQLRLRFRHGFIDHVSLVGADWLVYHAAIRAAVPVRNVTLTGWPWAGGGDVVHADWYSGTVIDRWVAAGRPSVRPLYHGEPGGNVMVRATWPKIQFTFAGPRNRLPPDRQPLTPPSVVMRKELSLR